MLKAAPAPPTIVLLSVLSAFLPVIVGHSVYNCIPSFFYAIMCVSLQKEATIRELTDRLMYGAEKFQEYLSSPSQQTSQYALHQKNWRTRSQPPVHFKERDRLRNYRLGRFYADNLGSLPDCSSWDDANRRRESVSISQCSSEQTLEQGPPRSPRDTGLSARALLRNQHPVYEERRSVATSEGYLNTPDVTSYRTQAAAYEREATPQGDVAATLYYVNSAFHTPSPQQDSAFDNSPSSDFSDRGSGPLTHRRAHSEHAAARTEYRMRPENCPIDLDAMERDASVTVAKKQRWSSVKAKAAYVDNSSYYDHVHSRPLAECGRQMSVSQI